MKINVEEQPLYDFDHAFLGHLTSWMQERAEEEISADQMEADMPEMYARWLNRPADFLDGVAPGLFYTQYDDAAGLVAWLARHVREDVPVPEPLMERIVALGAGVQGPLLALVESGEGLAMLALSLLQEIDAPPPIATYLALIHERDGCGEMAAVATEGLKGARAWRETLAAMEDADEQEQLCLMDVLADYPQRDEVRAHACRLFEQSDEKALMAAYIARLGADEALPMLYGVAQAQSTDYLTYIEVVNAIEVLGGDMPAERDFQGDDVYDSLRRMK